jgi:hypothetical protein
MLRGAHSKRNYVRRKKCLKDSVSLVKHTLAFIHRVQGASPPAAELERQARHHAEAIEAICWDPHTGRVTDSLYQELMMAKTRELCAVLLRQSVHQERVSAVVQEIWRRHLPASEPRPLPIPLLRASARADADGADFGAPEPFGEMAHLRFEQADLFPERWSADE